MRIGPLEVIVIVVVVAVLLVLVGLQRRRRPANHVLAEIFGEQPGPLPGPRARTWALGVLHEAGVDSDSDPVYAIKMLRDAEPRLTLQAAKVLVDTLNRY